MHRFERHGLLSNRFYGLTLIELLVTLAILSILAAAALPYAELTVKRENEHELRAALREIRVAIDRFNEDWRSGKISHTSEGASEYGYPKRLDVLVSGVDSGDAKGTKRRYMRRIPTDPMAQQGVPVEEQWVLRSYQDDLDAGMWGGQDVYDVHTAYEGTAIDGTRYSEW